MEIESSRFNNRLAWFVGNANAGDYYDQSTGRYLGSWTRDQGNFSKDELIEQDLFDLEVWKDRHKKPSGLLTQVVQKINNLITSKSAKDSFQLPSGRHIAFVGDSFCAHVSFEHLAPFMRSPGTAGYRAPTDAPAWPSLAADALQINLAPYGFCARSWWYSWQRFWGDWQDRLADLDAVIFCHTDCMRINHAENDSVPNILGKQANKVYADVYKEAHVQAAETYLGYIAERSFHRWCQQQFFRHIREVMPGIKMVHFFCFDRPLPETCQVLPGMIFSTPLVTLSMSEIGVKNSEQIADRRPNHFGDHNNKVIGRIVQEALDCYNPGVYDLPWRDFQHANPKKYRKFLDHYLSNPNNHI